MISERFILGCLYTYPVKILILPLLIPSISKNFIQQAFYLFDQMLGLYETQLLVQ